MSIDKIDDSLPGIFGIAAFPWLDVDRDLEAMLPGRVEKFGKNPVGERVPAPPTRDKNSNSGGPDFFHLAVECF